jgi:hypothetical protein
MIAVAPLTAIDDRSGQHFSEFDQVAEWVGKMSVMALR